MHYYHTDFVVINKAKPSQSLVSGPLQFMKSMRAGGILGLQGRKLQHYLQVVRQLQGHDLYEYGYVASGIPKHYSHNKLDFPKRHAGGGSETKD